MEYINASGTFISKPSFKAILLPEIFIEETTKLNSLALKHRIVTEKKNYLYRTEIYKAAQK